MTPEMARDKREQVIRDGYCVIDDILTEDFLQELHEESERLIDAHEPPDDMKYQGQHVSERGEDNRVIQKLLEWEPSRQALEQLGFGDFVSNGGIIILTKDPGEPALYWHQDWMRWNDPFSCSPWPQTIFLSYYLSDDPWHPSQANPDARPTGSGARTGSPVQRGRQSDHVQGSPGSGGCASQSGIAGFSRCPRLAFCPQKPDRRAKNPHTGLARSSHHDPGGLGSRNPRSHRQSRSGD